MVLSTMTIPPLWLSKWLSKLLDVPPLMKVFKRPRVVSWTSPGEEYMGDIIGDINVSLRDVVGDHGDREQQGKMSRQSLPRFRFVSFVLSLSLHLSVAVNVAIKCRSTNRRLRER